MYGMQLGPEARSTSWTLVFLAALAASTTSTEALACGPDFPVEHLTRRAETLLELPEGTFFFEAEHLVVPRERFPVVEGPEPGDARLRGSHPERRLYDGGADAFHRGRHADAAAVFRELLALPVAERQWRSTWAAYMLGKLLPFEEAVANFRRVRAFAHAGFKDELGLAAASLGDEARLYLERGDDVEAVRLYAEQASLGSASGSASLLFVVREVVAHPRRLAPLLDDEVGQRLVAAYLYARPHEVSEAQLDEVLALAEARLAARPGDAGLEGGDRVAAVAYRRGRWALAERLALLDVDSVLSRRVLAKLALRRGDRQAAARLLAAAAEACRPPRVSDPLIPLGGERVDPASEARLHVERGTLFMAEAAYAPALRELLTASDHGLSPDAIYAAERILTSDELTAVLDEGDVPHARELGPLLARRLMREGRHAEAMPRFTDDEVRGWAVRYARALEAADDEDDPVRRAAHLFDAAEVARAHGLAMLATTREPDWAYYDAAYAPDAVPPSAADPEGHFTTEGEVARWEASAPSSPERFHYRFLAADLAERAADLVPPRSQAFAALLCHAARYVQYRDEGRRVALWKRYAREGAAVDFAPTFGEHCPAPDFVGAARRQSALSLGPLGFSPLAWGTLQLLGVAGIGLLVVITALARRARRWRAVV